MKAEELFSEESGMTMMGAIAPVTYFKPTKKKKKKKKSKKKDDVNSNNPKHHSPVEHP